ncbi:MAG: acyl-CoA reductase [Cyclobacteriaceae bacterium]|nr:acyl-CoA reductase [Cyclobacteriaceae bacterium]
MTLEKRLSAFVQLGDFIRSLDDETLTQLANEAANENPWFTKANVRLALSGIQQNLTKENLNQWTSQYDFNHVSPKSVGLVMAGNIPLVGFHDLLSVLISGHKAMVKLSSKDSKLMTFLLQRLYSFEPDLKEAVAMQQQALKGFDAVIATGSDNTARHFEYYFRNVPNIIRRNRTSCAILTGKESQEELHQLGEDVFSYFGLGCRNVSKLFVPNDYDVTNLFQAWNDYEPIIHHHKYANNYDYQKSILLVNKETFLDNGFVLLQESERLVSPIAVLYYQRYTSLEEITNQLKVVEEKIQCVVGHAPPATIPLGQAQHPALWDYADGVDTMNFLTSLR